MFRRIRSGVKRLYDVRKLLSIPEHVKNVRTLKGVVLSLITPKSPERTESFEEALARLGLTEHGLQMKAAQFYRLFIIYLILAIVFFVNFLTLLWSHYYGSAILGFGITGILLCLAFRFHFWLYQIRERKLGCSIDDWLNSRVKEG